MFLNNLGWIISTLHLNKTHQLKLQSHRLVMYKNTPIYGKVYNKLHLRSGHWGMTLHSEQIKTCSPQQTFIILQKTYFRV